MTPATGYGILLALLLLGSIFHGINKQRALNEYSHTQDVPPTHKTAIQNETVISGMSKKEVEIIFNKGELVESGNEYTVYLYKSKRPGKQISWLVAYDDGNNVLQSKRSESTTPLIQTKNTSTNNIHNLTVQGDGHGSYTVFDWQTRKFNIYHIN